MGIVAVTDAADMLNAKAFAEGWPFQCDSKLLFDRPELTMLRDVWRSRAAKVGLPTRNDLGAHALKSVLRHLSILERMHDAERGTRYRILHMGSYIAAVMGEKTGCFIDESIPTALLPRWTTPFDTVLETRTPIRIVSRFEHQKLDYATGESFLAPLSNDAGEASVLMSCLYLKPRE
ncbi:MAG TPA: PAS domain-containing protein [Rhizomicrobium sp.]|nr:PAS domain-containing protein [Rhizomicrobium sp.]